jgi:pimeloyl-ACP methyl ester carboxylesterase
MRRRATKAQLNRMIAAGRRSDAVKYFMRKMVGVPAIFVVLMRLMPWIWRKLEAVAHTLPYDAAVLGDWSLPTARLASITIPVLAMAGEKTDVRLGRAVRAVADAVPNAQHRTLRGQTHNVAPEVITPVVVEFFADLTTHPAQEAFAR